MYQSNIFGKEGSKNKLFHVPIENSNNTEIHYSYPHVLEIKYVQNKENKFVLSGLGNSFFASN